MIGTSVLSTGEPPRCPSGSREVTVKDVKAFGKHSLADMPEPLKSSLPRQNKDDVQLLTNEHLASWLDGMVRSLS